MTQHEGIKLPNTAAQSGKTFDCDLCPFQFTQLSSLKRHKMAKHSGDTYNCEMCEYMGTTPNNLRLHKRSKHEGVRFPCDLCGFEGTQASVTKRHKQQKHGIDQYTETRNHNPQNQYVSQKALRDPNAPKRPLSGFFHFSNVGRAKVKAANPDWGVGEISKELSRRWHELDDVTRSMFEEMATNDKQRFQREKAEYQQQPNSGQYQQRRTQRDPNAPKRPLCAFMCFSNDMRSQVMLENPNFGVGHRGEIVKELGRRWAVADTETRQKYTEIANQDKERFGREKSEYQMSPYAGGYRMKRAKKDPSAPKRNLPAFMWFSSEERPKVTLEIPGGRVSEIAKELGRRWALADVDTRAKFEEMAITDKQRYEKEKHEWHMKQRENDLSNAPANVQARPALTHVQPITVAQPQAQAQPVAQVVHHQAPINHHNNTTTPTVRYGY